MEIHFCRGLLSESIAFLYLITFISISDIKRLQKINGLKQLLEFFLGMFYDHVSLVAPSKIEVCILTQFEKMHLLYSTSLFFWCYWMFEGSFICHANTLPTILWLHALISKCNWIWNFWKRYNSIFVKDLFRSIDFVSMCSPLWLNCFMAYNELKLLNKEPRKNIVGMTVRFTFFQLDQVLF